jgi:peptidoglycan/LPS O-acetylase OafA/YrhL
MVTPEDATLRRLPFIDGVRGLAAVVVLVGHMVFIVPTMRPERHSPAVLLWPFRFGDEMVDLFILVSGFSLYYSELVRRRRGKQATTYRQFAKRRAWRIGPVYYAALAFGLIVSLSVRHLAVRTDNALTQLLSAGGVLSHLAFVHNLRVEWAFQVNAPLWSIAYEVQLYLLFPLIFYGMRRWNPLLVACLIAGPLYLLHERGGLSFPVFGLAWWFVAGALLAEFAERGVRLPIAVSLPIGLVALGVGVAHPLGGVRHDAVWLVAFVGLMAAMIEAPDSVRNPMTWPIMRWLGLRSYSIYALHWPLMIVLLAAAEAMDLNGGRAALFTAGLGIPAALLLSALNFRYIEGPSLRKVAAVSCPG